MTRAEFAGKSFGRFPDVTAPTLCPVLPTGAENLPGKITAQGPAVAQQPTCPSDRCRPRTTCEVPARAEVVTTQARLRFRPRPTGNRGPAPWSPLRVWPAVWQSQSSRGLTLGTRVESARDQGKNRRARVRSASGAGGGGEQAQVAGPGDGLGPAVGAKLGVQVADMGLDGIGRDIQLAGDFRPGQVGGQVAQHAQLAI